MYISAIDSVFCILYTFKWFRGRHSSSERDMEFKKNEKIGNNSFRMNMRIHIRIPLYAIVKFGIQLISDFDLIWWYQSTCYNWIQQRTTPEQWCDLLNFGWNNGMTAPFFGSTKCISIHLARILLQWIWFKDFQINF